jgi:hypothetical protein
VAGSLLFLSLFFTWQNVSIDYGRAGVAKVPLDGWDAWGALLALLVVATVVLVAVRHLTDVELSDRVPWPTLTFGLGVAVAAVAAVKNLTDAHSTITSYAFVALACVVAAGTYLDWVESRRGEHAALSRRGRGFSSAA